MHKKGYYLAKKKKGINATTWMSLKIIMQSERSHTQKYTQFDSIYIKL